jgi:CheY-specific phosphatase CheX
VPEADDALAAEVTLRGDWNGSVRLVCDPATADRLARTMLAVNSQTTLPDRDVHDALGEVVNIVGGNVKGALGGQTSLGLPVVAPHSADGRVPVSRRAVEWLGSPVVVEVFGVDGSGPHLHEGTGFAS